MCTTHKRTNKPFETAASTFRSDVAVEKKLNVVDNQQMMYQHCLKRAIAKTALKEDNKYREADFLKDAATRVNLLLNALHFIEWCRENNQDSFAVATHVVMQGITVLRKTLCDDLITGGEITLTSSKDWNKPIFTREELGIPQDTSPVGEA